MTAFNAAFASAFEKTWTAVWGAAVQFITSLFGQGQNGAIHDESDLTTLFQDAVGTTLVTAVEQPLGLMLDKRFGLARGPELIVNGNAGTFNINIAGITANNAAALSRDTSIFLSGGLKAVCTVNTAGSGAVIGTFATTPGQSYEIKCEAYAPSANIIVNGAVISTEAAPLVNSSRSAQVTTEDAIQSLRFVYVALATTTTIYGFVLDRNIAWGGVGDAAYFDNITVKLLDGNHLFQATAASRPVNSARVNVLLKTEQFDDPFWPKADVSVVANSAIDPLGTNTADKLNSSAVLANHLLNLASFITVTTGLVYSHSIYAKASEYNFIRLQFQTGGFPETWANFNLTTGLVGLTAGVPGAVIVSAGNGWFRCSITATATATAAAGVQPFVLDADRGTASPAYSGVATSGIFIWGAQLELSPATTRYQRVNTATDYDSQGFPFYGRHDGIDDSMSTTTGGGGTAGYFLCQGIKPTGGAGTIRTIWSDEQVNAGYRVRLNAANQLELSSGSGTPLAPPVQAAATTSTVGGTGLAASTAYFYVVTALNVKGESLKSNEQSVTTGLGTTNSNSLSWAAAAGATDYRVYRGLTTGAQDVFYVTGNVLAFTDTGAAATTGAPPLVSETAYSRVATAASTTIGTTSLATVWDDGTNLNAQLGSGAVASVARTVVAAGTAGFTAGKRNGAATGFFTGNLYADVYRQTALIAAERSQVQRYVADKAGI